MAGFPLMQLAEKLAEEDFNKAVAPSLLSLAQAFRWYNAVHIAHCDRAENHVLFRRALSWKNMPIGIAIDHDRITNYKHDYTMQEASPEAQKRVKSYRRHMAHWFAVTVNNVCMLGNRKSKMWLGVPMSSCPVDGPSPGVMENQMRALGVA